ncbi:MAG: hypothetical protein AAFU64_14550, partial [Bacteroidota bacterium]
MNHVQMTLNLEEQRQDFSKRSFLAMPLAGLLIWLGIGIAGLFLPERWMTLVIYMGTGIIVYVGMFISKFTGEDFLDKQKPKNTFDQLFFFTVGQALLVYSLAIPFYLVEPQSLPLSVGILTGLMWMPFSWMIQHWVGIFHSLSRTISILILWYSLPSLRYVS